MKLNFDPQSCPYETGDEKECSCGGRDRRISRGTCSHIGCKSYLYMGGRGEVKVE